MDGRESSVGGGLYGVIRLESVFVLKGWRGWMAQLGKEEDRGGDSEWE